MSAPCTAGARSCRRRPRHRVVGATVAIQNVVAGVTIGRVVAVAGVDIVVVWRAGEDLVRVVARTSVPLELVSGLSGR